MTGYLSPDYPMAGTATGAWQYQDPNTNNQFFYGGYGNYGNGMPAVGDPNSRINQTSFNYAQSPYQQQYGYAQPQAQVNAPVVTPVQPFSAYGGSGSQNNQQPIMPTLGMTTTFNQPAPQSVPVQQPVQMPTFAQPMFYTNPMTPLFNAQIPSFDKRTECWGNQYVQPQQLPVPQIDWNKPVSQPFVNPMQTFQMVPSFNQPQSTFQDNWTDLYKRNFNV